MPTWLNTRRWNAPTRYASTVALCTFAFCIRWLAQLALPMGLPYVTFFPAIMLSTLLFGVAPGVFATIICGLAARYFFIPPLYSFELNGATGVALAFFSTVALINVAIVYWVQITQDRLEEERARSMALAHTRELLFRELQHRISNNLAVVSATLLLHRRNLTDDGARRALADASNRLAMIAKIQRGLYDPTGGPVELGTLLEGFASDVVESSGKSGITLAVEVDRAITIAPDHLVPCALIMAEAIANAIEHGFADRDKGQIDVVLVRSGTGAELSVTDDGGTLPEGFDIAHSDSLGLNIAQALAKQLGGRFHLSGGSRTTSRLILPG